MSDATRADFKLSADALEFVPQAQRAYQAAYFVEPPSFEGQHCPITGYWDWLHSFGAHSLDAEVNAFRGRGSAASSRDDEADTPLLQEESKVSSWSAMRLSPTPELPVKHTFINFDPQPASPPARTRSLSCPPVCFIATADKLVVDEQQLTDFAVVGKVLEPDQLSSASTDDVGGGMCSASLMQSSAQKEACNNDEMDTSEPTTTGSAILPSLHCGSWMLSVDSYALSSTSVTSADVTPPVASEAADAASARMSGVALASTDCEVIEPHEQPLPVDAEAPAPARRRRRSRGSHRSWTTKESEAPNAGDRWTRRFEVGIDEDDDFNVVRRIIGANGKNVKDIITKSEGSSVWVRGRGVKYLDGCDEGPLTVCISATSKDSFKRTSNLVEELLEGVWKEYRELHPQHWRRDPKAWGVEGFRRCRAGGRY